MSGPGWERIMPHLAAHGLQPDAAHCALITRYAELLLQWNRRINLTGARDADTLYTRHILDCLMLETVPRSTGLREWIDIGSGAGLPGLLVALQHPEYRVTAVETVAKKVTFQQLAARTLSLTNYTVLRTDVRKLARSPEATGRFDVAVARAFSDLDDLLALSAPLLRAGGELWAMKGARLAEEQARVHPAHQAPFHSEPRVFRYQFADLDQGGVIVIYRRREDAPTPA